MREKEKKRRRERAVARRCDNIYSVVVRSRLPASAAHLLRNGTFFHFETRKDITSHYVASHYVRFFVASGGSNIRVKRYGVLLALYLRSSPSPLRLIVRSIVILLAIEHERG